MLKEIEDAYSCSQGQEGLEFPPSASDSVGTRFCFCFLLVLIRSSTCFINSD